VGSRPRRPRALRRTTYPAHPPRMALHGCSRPSLAGAILEPAGTEPRPAGIPAVEPDPLGGWELSLNATSGREDWHDATRIGRAVDEACDRFEAAWRAGDRPRIEEFLADPTDPDDPMLLRYLLAVELDYRGGLGETPALSEYRRRFPGHEGLIDSVFARIAARSQPATGTGSETLDLPIGRDGPGRARRPSTCRSDGTGGVRGPPAMRGNPSRTSLAARSSPSWAAAGWGSSTRPARSGSTAYAP
jgi:hypothetical protein